MDTTRALDHFHSFISSQLQPSGRASVPEKGSIKCVTVSRQSGCGAHTFGEEVAAYIMAHRPRDARPWTLFDSTLVQAALQDHHLPTRLARFMPEDRVSQLNDMIHDVFSLHPPTESLVRLTAETILRLAELGNVIIIGRGGNVVTSGLPGMIHVRLIGSLEARAGHIERFDKLSRKDALARISREDTGRRRYLKEYFGKDIDDPLLYDLVINTDRIALRDAARLVGELALKCESPDKMKVPVAA